MRWSLLIVLLLLFLFFPLSTDARTRKLQDFQARPPTHIRNAALTTPNGLTPQQIKEIYHLPSTGGTGTIAIIGAYDAPSVESDLQTFSMQFNLPSCTSKTNCFEKHKMGGKIKADNGWATEGNLDTQWAHAIAPNAKILFVEAKSASGADLLKAVDFARSKKDVVAISMSWGGPEFEKAETLDSHFQSKYGATFFASSGDNGAGVQWPAASQNVIAVGGTTLHFTAGGGFSSESAWSGSGGGISSFIAEPAYQIAYNILHLNGKRAVPDVSYAADPSPGFSVYHTGVSKNPSGWFSVGGTSAGAPQWAALRALGKNISNIEIYKDAAGPDYVKYFRDILRGFNGDCGTSCRARKNYDTVTGLGSPLTTLY